jgi:phosphatidylglycerophosphate synthase
MSLQMEHQKSVPDNKNLFAVLVLSNPPPPHEARDWYWEPIAGVPFLLRNILSIQQGGVKRLIIYARKNMAGVEELFQRARDDSRVRVELECIYDAEDLVASIKSEGGALFLDGSVLGSKASVEEARESDIASHQQEISGPFLIDSEKLRSMIETNEDPCLLNGLRNSQFQDTCSPTDISGESVFKVVLAKADENWRVSRQEDFAIMGGRLIEFSGLSNDSFMDRYFTRRISRTLTRQILKTPITPNQMTIVSLAIGLEAAGCFLFGGYGMGLLGAGLLLLSACIDCSDGEIARLKFMESQFGKRLDIISDNLVHIAVFFAIGMGLFGSTDKSLFILLGSLAVLGSLICFIVLSPKIISSKSQSGHLKIFLERNKSLVDRLANRDFIYLLFIMALVGSLDIFIGLTALGANAFAGYLLYEKFKTAPHQSGNLSGN